MYVLSLDVAITRLELMEDCSCSRSSVTRLSRPRGISVLFVHSEGFDL